MTILGNFVPLQLVGTGGLQNMKQLINGCERAHHKRFKKHNGDLITRKLKQIGIYFGSLLTMNFEFDDALEPYVMNSRSSHLP